MIKNHFDYKLINTLIIVFTIYLVYQTRNIWLYIYNTLNEIFIPFLIAFILGYALHPFIKKLQSYKIPKVVALIIVLCFIIGIFVLIFAIIIPSFFKELGSIFNNIIVFIKKISIEYNIDLNNYEKAINNYFHSILLAISTNAFSLINVSFNYLTKAFIIFSAMIYFLWDMDKIKLFIKKTFYKNKKIYNFILLLDIEMTKFLAGFLKISIISFFEYFLVYFFIGHPNYLMLSSLASISNLIPYFGGIFMNIIASITALAVSDELFIKTLIVLILFSMIDGYVINPLVFGKSNKLHPLLIIIFVFAGGIIFGILGVLISLPIAIILVSIFKYFKEDLTKGRLKKYK